MSYNGLAILVAFPWVFSNIEAHNHFLRIIVNGSLQTLTHKFHRQALVWRCIFILGSVSLVGGLNYLKFGTFPWPVYLLYGGYAFCIMGYDFNHRLNRIRKEAFPDYDIPEWYVSKEKDAAWTDRMQVKYAARWKTTPEKLSCYIYLSALVIGLILGLLMISIGVKWK